MLHSVIAIEALTSFEGGTGIGDIKERIAERAAYLSSDVPENRLRVYAPTLEGGLRSTVIDRPWSARCPRSRR